MPQFTLGWKGTSTVAVKRNNVFFACLFLLPENIKESVPYDVTSHIEGDLVMGFYCDPVVGDVINYGGYHWRVCGRLHHPVRRNSRKKKRIAQLILEFLGPAEWNL